MSDNFILVKKSKKSFKKINSEKVLLEKSTYPVNLTIEHLENIKIELKNCEFLKTTETKLNEVCRNQINEIICLGIGKISEDIISKYQFIFILIIKEKFDIGKIKFYDPVFNDNDQKVLNYFKCEHLSENQEGKYTVVEPTIFYLPHCPKQLTNNLLFANWSTDKLKNLVLICNSFKSIIESTPERLLRPNASYILEINKYTTEHELPNTFKFNDIFNDFALHCFTHDLPDKLSTFWNKHPEPEYSEEDLEFIKNDSSKSP